jgi:DNA-binding LacI/PurR family transcriptional regulator
MEPILNQASEKMPSVRDVTLVQVAEHAGVSAVTASSVLNKSRGNTRVSAQTRQRILESAELLSYRPNVLARSLRQRKTNVLAFHNAHYVDFSLTLPFYASLLSGVQMGCTEHKKDLLVHANFAGRSDDDIFLGLNNGQIDGIVLYLRTMTPLVQRLVDSRLPLVTIAEEIPGVPYVGLDSENGGRLLAQHVASKGYKRVLYRGFNEPVMSLSRQQRQHGFFEEAEKLGLQVTSTKHPPSIGISAEEKQLLSVKASERPQVAVCWNDDSADAFAEFCLEQGLRIPEDIAITGFDGLISLRRPALRLTTVYAPWAQVTKTAVGHLVSLCNGEKVPGRTIIPVEMMPGDTT